MVEINSKEEFKEFVDGLDTFEPKAFGVCRNSMGQVNQDKVLMSSYIVTNHEENYGSAKVFKHVIDELNTDNSLEVHVSGNELVYNITPEFVQNALGIFQPYVEEANHSSHLNVEAMKILASINQQFEQSAAAGQVPPGVGFGKHEYTYRLAFLMNTEEAVETVEGGYLKLMLLSQGKVKLRSMNLDGLFGKLTNCAWVNGNPVELGAIKHEQMFLHASNQFPNIAYVDKFPQFLRHVVPADNTRILDTHKVRFGAQLADGTTVMPGASYINFNAGTEGPCMVEGRISSSVVVGAGTDIGGSASIAGILSGGNSDPITIGKNCLLGANSSTAISYGDGCIIDLGAAVASGTKIKMTKTDYEKISHVNETMPAYKELYKGSELSGLNGVHYRLDSEGNGVIAKRSTFEIELNKDLH